MFFNSSRKLRALADGYSVEVDRVEEAAWHGLLDQFTDANIYQTLPYESVRSRRENISHLVLKKDGDVVAAAQARIVKVPFVKAGIAYVRWGPVWRRRDAAHDPEIFRQAIRALRNEYAGRRGLVIRLYPALFRDPLSGFPSILDEEGFSHAKEPIDRTLCLDITRSTTELRAGLRSHWKRYLKVAEKGGLEVIEGTDGELFEAFIRLYRQMLDRKRFAEPNDIRQFREAQDWLPQKYKMKIMLCKAGDEFCAGLICSAIGDTGVYLFGATSDAGLKARGAYLLHWKLIEWLKDQGIATYDLHGINPVTNPGTYRFKADLCGDAGRDATFLGRFESCTNFVSHSCVALGENVRAAKRNIRKKLADRAAPKEPEYANLAPAQGD
jgi:lipid II:glycine glycyltransferase (peptidoglycan interpeptide bridge formation enzyme)